MSNLSLLNVVRFTFMLQGWRDVSVSFITCTLISAPIQGETDKPPQRVCQITITADAQHNSCSSHMQRRVYRKMSFNLPDTNEITASITSHLQ